VIEAPQDESGSRDVSELLQEASTRERERRRDAPGPVLVINDENLAQRAEGGRLTIGTATAPELDPREVGRAGAMVEQESYWRTRVREVRQRWRDAHDHIAELEARAEELRTQFYAADDPVRRDRDIKPQWDRTLERLEQARRTTESARQELDALLDEGHRAGALPGWLADGVELEPPSRGADQGAPKTTEPGEPSLVEEPR
jgi:hypothetical protein